jgi:hypothetical protein
VSEMTIAQLRSQVDGTVQSATLDYVLAQSHDERVAAVQKAVDFACNLLEQHKSKKQNFGEDQITIEICEMLQMAGFHAEHDSYVAGHCDIVIKGKDLFLWLAEAKSHSSYAWLDKGFKQLSRRYSTGVVGQDNGDVIVYCYNQDANAMMNAWRDELVARNADVKTEASACGNPLIFKSRHKHHASGLDFHVRHKAIAMYWRPTDA